jgi:hypothetical protein
VDAVTAGLAAKHPLGHLPPFTCPSLDLPLKAQVLQRLAEFTRHVDAPAFMVLWSGHFKMRVVPSNFDKPALPIDVWPLQT